MFSHVTWSLMLLCYCHNSMSGNNLPLYHDAASWCSWLINIYISINNDQFLSVFSFQGTEKINFTIVKLTLEPCFAGFRGLDMFCFIPRLSHQPSGTRNNFTLLISHRSCDIWFINKSGSRLLFHTVSSIVPSAVQVLTVVFGMRTGVAPARIATRQT